MRIILLLIMITLLTGCAVLDVSSLETAIPLPPRRVEISTNQSVGLDLETVVLEEDELVNGDSPPGYMPGTSSVTGVQAAIGLENQMEVGTRFWISPYNYGAKIFLKKLMNQNGSNYLALQPAFTYLNSVDESDGPNGDEEYTAIGSELQLIYTMKASPYFALSLIGRGNVNRYQHTLWDVNGDEIINGPHTIIHGGFRGNLELRLHPFFFIPELGFEIVPVINGETSVVPVVGFALGVEL